ncbi:hypothetical protein ABPG77_010770 [Micractinium sp. CCAP 211/92]
MQAISASDAPLHLAAARGGAEAVAGLVGSPRSSKPGALAALHALDDLGNTPLHLAAALNGNLNVIRLLVYHGANLRARNAYGNTPVSLAAAHQPARALLQQLAEGGPAAVSRLQEEMNAAADAAAQREQERVEAEAAAKRAEEEAAARLAAAEAERARLEAEAEAIRAAEEEEKARMAAAEEEARRLEAEAAERLAVEAAAAATAAKEGKRMGNASRAGAKPAPGGPSSRTASSRQYARQHSQ